MIEPKNKRLLQAIHEGYNLGRQHGWEEAIQYLVYRENQIEIAKRMHAIWRGRWIVTDEEEET